MSALDTYGASASHSTILGLSYNAGTVRATAITAGIIVIAALVARGRITTRVPGRLQLAGETVVELVERQLGPSAGRRRAAVPLALSLFVFILVANALRAIPGTSELLPTPTADLNLTAALAIIVVLVVHTASVRSRGVRGYVRHYFQPYWWLAPINLLEELVRPLTLALRLFGTAFAGGLMLALIGELVRRAGPPCPTSSGPFSTWPSASCRRSSSPSWRSSTTDRLSPTQPPKTPRKDHHVCSRRHPHRRTPLVRPGLLIISKVVLPPLRRAMDARRTEIQQGLAAADEATAGRSRPRMRTAPGPSPPGRPGDTGHLPSNGPAGRTGSTGQSASAG